MVIRFTCPHCGKVTDVDDQYAGLSGPCAACGKGITIPKPPAAGAGPPPPPPPRSGKPVVVILAIVAAVLLVMLLLCAGLMIPAVMSVREAAHKATSINDLRQIGLAMHNYHSLQTVFPARANFDQRGKPLLSWRVLILPFVDEEALYQQFHLDEPWDSEHNRRLIPRMPDVFRNRSGSAKPGMTNYLAVCGKGLAFDGNRGRRIADFLDGLSDTILVVEADPDRAVVWTKPDDWQYDATQPLAGLGHAHPAGFNALFGDASVHFIPKTIDPKGFHAFLTIDGNDATPSLDDLR